MDHKFPPNIARRCTAQAPPRVLARFARCPHRALTCYAARGSFNAGLSRACRAVASRAASAQDAPSLFLVATAADDLIDAPAVVLTALTLWAQEPALPALAVLDRAMRIHAHEDLDFQFDGDDELAPPHPFSELIRRAFAPQLDPTELCMSFVEWPLGARELRMRLARARRQWSRVILRFAERYRIWEPEG